MSDNRVHTEAQHRGSNVSVTISPCNNGISLQDPVSLAQHRNHNGKNAETESSTPIQSSVMADSLDQPQQSVSPNVARGFDSCSAEVVLKAMNEMLKQLEVRIGAKIETMATKQELEKLQADVAFLRAQHENLSPFTPSEQVKVILELEPGQESNKANKQPDPEISNSGEEVRIGDSSLNPTASSVADITFPKPDSPYARNLEELVARTPPGLNGEKDPLLKILVPILRRKFAWLACKRWKKAFRSLRTRSAEWRSLLDEIIRFEMLRTPLEKDLFLAGSPMGLALLHFGAWTELSPRSYAQLHLHSPLQQIFPVESQRQTLFEASVGTQRSLPCLGAHWNFVTVLVNAFALHLLNPLVRLNVSGYDCCLQDHDGDEESKLFQLFRKVPKWIGLQDPAVAYSL